MRRYQKIGILLALAILLFSGCSAQLREESEVRDGTSEDTLATPEDFPEAYDYGSGLLNGWSYHDMYRRLPEPEGNQTVLNTNPDAGGFQALYLWERGNVPARTEITEDMTGYESGSFYRTGPTDSAVTADGSEITESGWNRFFLWTSDRIRAIDTPLDIFTFYFVE